MVRNVLSKHIMKGFNLFLDTDTYTNYLVRSAEARQTLAKVVCVASSATDFML